MKYLMGALLALAGWMAAPLAQAYEQGENWIAIDLTDARTLYMRDIAPDLMLAIRKEGNSGWSLEAVQRPLTANAPNLIGAEASQVSASQVQARTFQNPRVVPLQGMPYELRIELSDAKVGGKKGAQAAFTGGKLRVSWTQTGPVASPEKPAKSGKKSGKKSRKSGK